MIIVRFSFDGLRTLNLEGMFPRIYCPDTTPETVLQSECFMGDVTPIDLGRCSKTIKAADFKFGIDMTPKQILHCCDG